MKNLKKLIALTTVSVTTFLVLTTVVSAQSGAVGAQQGFGTLAGLITTFNNTIVKALGTLFISGAVVAFMFGIAQFIWGMREGVEKNITNGKQFMIWGIIALFVMFSVYGIINLIRDTLCPECSNTIIVPNVRYQGGGSPGSNTGGPSNPDLRVGSPGSNTGAGGGRGVVNPAVVNPGLGVPVSEERTGPQ